MTPKQFSLKYDELARQVPAMLREFKRAALASGSLDLESVPDDYRMAKAVLSVALRDISAQWAPHTLPGDALENIWRCTYPNYSRCQPPKPRRNTPAKVSPS